MTPPTTETVWFTSGFFAGISPIFAFAILAISLAIGLCWSIISYRFTLVPLPPWRRLTLWFLRLVALSLVVLILAGPIRIERAYLPPVEGRPLAVLVDRSDSMTTPDNRAERRLDYALLRWHRAEPAALEKFRSIQSFAFAQGHMPVSNPSSTSSLPGGRTELYNSLLDILASAPHGGWGGIVTLTDGNDTSGLALNDEQGTIASAALAASTPLFFIVGRNHTLPQPFFRLREVHIPARTSPRSVIRASATFESYQTVPSTLPVEFTVDGHPQPSVPLQLEEGHHLETWSGNYTIDKTGTIIVGLQAGLETARAQIRVAPQRPLKILYDLGTVDWSYHFLARILNPQFYTVTPVFNYPTSSTFLRPGTLTRMPVSLEDLKPYDLIFLVNARADQIVSEQQQALTQWVRAGGILVFVASDDASIRSFSGSELERSLPVFFGTDHDPTSDVPRPIGANAAAADPDQLTPFSWETTPLVREIFNVTPNAEPISIVPRFASYGSVIRPKAGAQVLARHPAAIESDGKHAILLATQRYGHGQSAVLLADSLWRWQLVTASKNRSPELFWTDLISWLDRDRDIGISFDFPPVHELTGSEVTLHVTGADPASVHVEAILENQNFTLTKVPSKKTFAEFTWQPTTDGLWKIKATNDRKDTAVTWIQVDHPAVPDERSGQPPNEELLAAIASSTGGSVIEEAPASWHREKKNIPQLISEKRTPLWHNSRVFALLLGAYLLEMLMRRRWLLL